MPLEVTTWTSFWDLIGPEEAALLLKELYGPGAHQAAAQCVAAAKDDDRETDHFFWLAVAAELKKDSGVAAAVAQPISH